MATIPGSNEDFYPTLTDRGMNIKERYVYLGNTASANNAYAPMICIAPAPAEISDLSGSITVGGTAQVLFSANTLLQGFALQNLDEENPLYFREIGDEEAEASNGAGSIYLAPLAYFESLDDWAPIQGISIYSDTTGHVFTAKEW